MDSLCPSKHGMNRDRAVGLFGGQGWSRSVVDRADAQANGSSRCPAGVIRTPVARNLVLCPAVPRQWLPLLRELCCASFPMPLSAEWEQQCQQPTARLWNSLSLNVVWEVYAGE